MNRNDPGARPHDLLAAGRAIVDDLRDPTGDEDPIELFHEWYDAAESAGLLLPDAMALATVSEAGEPSVRMVLLKGSDAGGFRFFTNHESPKARDLEATGHAALCFHWTELERQVRVQGPVERLTEEVSRAYFQTRPRGSRIGAWASAQSRPLESREALVARVREYEERFEGEDVPLPPQWGGYVVVPSRIEFWQGRENRLHDRWVFTRDSRDLPWTVQRLQP